MTSRRFLSRQVWSVVLILLMAALLASALPMLAPPDRSGAALAQTGGEVPGNALGNQSDSDLWRKVRRGERFGVSIPDKHAGVLVQSEGDNWRAVRNGPLSIYSGWALGAIIVLLVLFFGLRGRIRVEHGLSGRTIERFNGIERFAHWLTAVSFIILAITGLNVMFGRYLFGGSPTPAGDVSTLHQLFAQLTYYGKFAHNFVAFGFMAGVALMLVLWVAHNFPNRHDVVWLLKGGGLFVKGVHPPSKKFNAGQKLIFWLVVLGGLSLSLSGIALMFPFRFGLFADTFAILNMFGAGLPTELTPMQEMQLSQIWHAVVAVGLIVVIIAHVYIGTLGMEGAFDAMGTGMVDENWAREHHSIWAEKVLGAAAPRRAEAAGDD